MNRICVLIPIAFHAGCGGGNDPLFDGFQPMGGTAVVLAPAVCDIPFAGSSAVSGIGFFFSDVPAACDVVMQTMLCGNKANATSVAGYVLDGEVGGSTLAPARPGTYRFLRDPPSGAFQASTVAAARVDGACMGDTFGQDGGTITIAAVTSTNITGSLDVDFENSTNLAHDFDVTLCPVTVDLCDRLSFGCVGQFVCVP
jgi:hypothetical protein